MLFAYGRTSTENQNLDSQLDRFKLLGVSPENIFVDQDSGKLDDRKELQKLLNKLRSGDKVVFYDLTRLGRNPKYLITLVEHFYENNINFQDITNPFINTESTKTAEGEFVFGVFAFLGQFVRKSIVEKVNAGIASAKARGKTGGRPSGPSDRTKEIAALAVIMHKNPNTSISDIRKTFNISQGTVYKCFEHEGYDYKNFHKNTGNNNRTKNTKIMITPE